jgi:hypothetical protein
MRLGIGRVRGVILHEPGAALGADQERCEPLVEVDRSLGRGAHVVRCMAAPSAHEMLNDEPAGPRVFSSYASMLLESPMPRCYQNLLDDPAVPADNNGTGRDSRSLAAARSDGGTHRAGWSAATFARLKSVTVTGMKNQVRFIKYGIEVVRAKLRGERLPRPSAAAPDTS